VNPLIVAIGLGGPEDGFSRAPFAPFFARARRAGYAAVSHAGETGGAAHVREAVEDLLARRVQHGVRAIEDESVLRLLAEREICCDVALTSNAQTRGQSPRLYVFDGGVLASETARYRLTDADVEEVSLSVASFLIVHPRGVLMWDAGAVADHERGGDLGFETLDELHEEMGRILASSATEAMAHEAPETVGPSAPTPADVPAARSLHLFTYPLLVDEGRLSERADELKAALEEPAFVEVHPSDAEAAGLVDGRRVTVRTAAGVAELDARVTHDIAVGAVFVPFNQPGLAANTLLSGELTTDVTLEAVAPASTDAEPQAVAVGGEAP